MSNNLHSAIQRLLAGASNDADLQTIISAIQTGRLVLAPVTGAVTVDHNVENSQLISGSNNVIDNNNIYINRAIAESIQTLLHQRSPVPLEALIQELRSTDL